MNPTKCFSRLIFLAALLLISHLSFASHTPDGTVEDLDPFYVGCQKGLTTTFENNGSCWITKICFETPSTNYDLELVEVHKFEDKYLIEARLVQNGIGFATISPVFMDLKICGEHMPVEYKISGRDFNWTPESDQKITWVDSLID